MARKKVYYHQLIAYKSLLTKATKTRAAGLYKKELSIQQLDNKIQHILFETANEFNCVQLNEQGETLELLHYTDDYYFARLGKIADIRSYQLRDRDTLKPDPIQVNAGQQLEVFTYVLISRETYIVSYLKQISSPSIQSLGNLITDTFYEDEKVRGLINSITIDDALPLLAKKDTIGTIKYRLSLPPEGSEYFNHEVTGLSKKQYEALSNQKSVEIDVKLVAKRNKDAFEDDEDRSAFTKLISGIAEKAKFVKVKAKNNDERMQELSIVNDPFTKHTDFDLTSHDIEEVHKEIYRKMKRLYESDSEDILKLCRIPD